MATISYSKRGPFVAVSIPGTNPGITLSRGDSAEIKEKDAKSFFKALDDDVIPGLKKEHFDLSTGAEEDEEDLESLTVPVLKDRAKAAGIEGYSTMLKEDLIKALSESE